MNRDYSSISPSAKALLLMKGLTNIPFMAEAARMICGEQSLDKLKGTSFEETFLKRLIHFESRYLSLDSVLFAAGSLNILEISSGFSFRGLNMVLNHPNVFFLDTDLSAIIEDKRQLIDVFTRHEHLTLKGTLRTQALNVLNQDAFEAAVAQMPTGRLSIINEGLLMYLNYDEKVNLCQIIHKTLKQRNGYWITADVYIRKKFEGSDFPDSFNQFLADHHVEQNKFDSFEAAEQFFLEQGFKLVTKATSVWHQLSSVKYVAPEMLKKWIQQNQNVGKIRETWALKAI